jgi:hypothetical protein
MDEIKDKQATILEQNNTILDNFHHDLKDCADEQNKVKIIDFKSPSFFLPPTSKVQELLGNMDNQKPLIDLVESFFGIQLKISRTSKYALFNQGVGLRTVNKIVNWLKNIPIPWKELINRRLMAKVERSIRVGSNAGSWLSSISGFRLSDHGEFEPLLSFIEQRCNTEVELLLRIKEAEKPTSDDIAAKWQAQQPLWRGNPYIPPNITESVTELILLEQQGKKLNEQQSLSFVESYFYLYFDFYLEAITYYEIGYLIHFHFDVNQDKIENQLGLLTRVINAYAAQDNRKTCFSCLLKEFKELYKTSYRNLASFIVIEESEPSLSGEFLEDKQYKQFKDWRNGKNLPGKAKLTRFLKNLDKYANIESGSITFDMCRITMGVDKLVNELLLQTKNVNCKQVDVEVAIKKVLSNIPNYYRQNLKSELRKREPKM